MTHDILDVRDYTILDRPDTKMMAREDRRPEGGLPNRPRFSKGCIGSMVISNLRYLAHDQRFDLPHSAIPNAVDVTAENQEES